MKRIACLVLWLLMAEPACAVHSEYDLKAQVDTLLRWWPGDYDNHEQIVRQSGGGLSPLTDRPFFRVHSRYERVSRPELGPNVLTMRDYRNDDPSQVLRNRTYVLAIDKAAGAVRVSQYENSAGGSGEFLPLGAGCDLLLYFVGGQFEASLPPRSCKANNEPLAYGLVVGPRYVWYRAQQGQDWFQQTRARWFTCMVFESATGDMPKTRYLKTLRLHDQGGEADLAWPDGRTLTFTIHSRAFTALPEREYPLFRIHEKGKPIPIAYAYAADDAARFGLNLGWFYTRCYADGQDLGADAAYK